ncbi:hypothetical protein OHT52_03040 [Streptomyces sp. NBC_00247]|uniref:RHS repeat-associated core domain-containing protein n=1 Tax=Streptomyces sp. NBC_00247 TaxID=2975689 RepID=UPI002E2AB808|nr:RHS repeat-associated core domain-containing protein [Streptomyces sp. NBC_00247]
MGAREFDPATGRFLSADPLLETGKPPSLNGYSYAENNPVTLADPTGMYVRWCSFSARRFCRRRVRQRPRTPLKPDTGWRTVNW